MDASVVNTGDDDDYIEVTKKQGLHIFYLYGDMWIDRETGKLYARRSYYEKYRGGQ